MKSIGILLFENVEELDFVGPWEVFACAKKLGADIDLFTFAEREGPVHAAKGLRVLPDRLLRDVPSLDVLVVPGGQGTRREMNNAVATGFVRRVAPGCTWITSVCTGALVLQGAGLLDGKRATTHWASTDLLSSRGGVTVLGGRRYVRDGNVVTAAGVSAGIDMALWVVGQMYSPDTARNVQRAMEYDPAPPYAAEV